MHKQSFIYILTNEYNTTLYIGVTFDLLKRVYEHKNKFVEGFSSAYNLNKLVYFEQFDNIIFAIEREKQLKNWKRKWKDDLIKDSNPTYKDLYQEVLGGCHCGLDPQSHDLAMLNQVQHDERRNVCKH